MGNRDLEIGFDFMAKSLYGFTHTQRPRQKQKPPLPFKIYQHTPLYPLEQAPPLTLGDPRWSKEQPAQSERIGLTSLSTLLYYTYGISRHDVGPDVVWPYHRFVASARCFFPTELYLWLPTTATIPAGIYHYDAPHHSLTLLRPGEYRALLALALDTRLDDCACVLFTSALFWKNAFHYHDFAYRLCTQEAGLVTSNTLLVAHTLGFTGHVHYQFLDQPLNQLLGFEADEESLLTVLPLYPHHEQSRQRLWQATTAQPLCDTIEPLALRSLKTSALDQHLCASLLTINHHSQLQASTEIVQATPDIVCPSNEERIAPPALSSHRIDLAQALSFRSSGDIDFLPIPASLTQAVFWDIMHSALSTYTHDLQEQPSPPRLQLYLVVQRVDGLERGIYRLCAHCHMLHLVERRDIALSIQAIQTQGNISTTQASVICYLVGDSMEAGNTFGNRAYRLLHLEAGLIAQRISVMSAAHGLVTRYSNSYDVARCQELLQLTGSPLVPIAELVLGYERAGNSRYRCSLLH